MAYPLKDFATALVATAPSPATSGSSLVVTAGLGTRFPTGTFVATAHPPNTFPTLDNAEKVLVTRTTDTFAITRAQGDTTAQPIAVGWRISAPLFKEHLDDKADGAASSTSGNLASYSGTTGKVLADSGISGSTLSSQISDLYSSKANLASPTFTGTVTIPTGASITAPTGLVKGDVGLGNVDNTSDATKNAASVTLTNKTLTTPTIADLTNAQHAHTNAASGGTIAIASTTGTLTVAKGGTGRATSTTAYGLLAAGTTATGIHQTIAPGTSGHFLKSGGASALGAFAAIAESDVTNLVTDLAAKQPLDSDLTTIAGLTATTDNFMVAASSAWASRTPAQAKTSLALAKADVGLGNVDNTTDVNKPVSTLQRTAIDDSPQSSNGRVVYEKSLWANLADFTVGGTTPTINTDGSIRMTYTGGTISFDNPRLALDSVYTSSDQLDVEVIFKVVTLDAASAGIAIGMTGSHPLVGHYYYRATAPIQDRLYFWPQASGAVATEIGSIPIDNVQVATGDLMRMIYSQRANTATITAMNLTKKTTAQYSVTSKLGATQDFIIPNTTKPTINCLRGTYDIQSIRVVDRQPSLPRIAFVGDSKTHGYSAVDPQLRFASLLHKYAPVAVFGGSGDRTADVVNGLSYITAFAPRYVVLNIGRNDINDGISSGTWQANYATIVAALKAAGATVIHLLALPETVLDQSALNSHINSVYSADQRIDVSGSWSGASHLSSDAVHPSEGGHRYIASQIVSSGYIPLNATENIIDFAPLPYIPPNVTKMVGFHATSVQSFTNAAQADITTYTEVTDNGANFDPTTGVFTAPTPGFYQFNLVVSINDATSATGRFDSRIKVNGTDVAAAHGAANSTSGDPSANISISLFLTTSDAVKGNVINNTGGTELLAFSSFSGYRVKL